MSDGKTMRAATWTLTASRFDLVSLLVQRRQLSERDAAYMTDDDVRRMFLDMVRGLSDPALDVLLADIAARS